MENEKLNQPKPKKWRWSDNKSIAILMGSALFVVLLMKMFSWPPGIPEQEQGPVAFDSISVQETSHTNCLVNDMIGTLLPPYSYSFTVDSSCGYFRLSDDAVLALKVGKTYDFEVIKVPQIDKPKIIKWKESQVKKSLNK